jgi:hypothetical protein
MLVWLRAFFSTPRRKSSNVPTSSLGLNLSRLKSGVFSFEESLGKLSAKGFAEVGGESVPGDLTGGLLGPGPTARRGIACMLTLLAVCVFGTLDAAMPNPLALCSPKGFATSPGSSSSCIVLGVVRSTAVASLCSLEKPGREAGGLVGGEMWVNPREWELSVKRRLGNAGVLPALSEMSDVSWISGRRSAIAPQRAGSQSLRFCDLQPGNEFQPLSSRLPYRSRTPGSLRWCSCWDGLCYEAEPKSGTRQKDPLRDLGDLGDYRENRVEERHCKWRKRCA